MNKIDDIRAKRITGTEDENYVIPTEEMFHPRVGNIGNDPSRKDLYFVVRDITPEVARYFLTLNRFNRRLKPASYLFFERMFASGQFDLTHQPIAFDTSGLLIDGQHRLAVGAKQERSFRIAIAYNANPSTIDKIDVGWNRTREDMIEMADARAGMEYWLKPNCLSILTMIYRNRKLSIEEQRRAAEPIKESLMFVAGAMRTTKRFLSHANVRYNIMLAHLNGADPQRLLEFCRALVLTEIMGPQDFAAVRLAEWLVKAHGSNRGNSEIMDASLRIQRAIQGFLNREPMKHLRPLPALIYEIPKEKRVELFGNYTRHDIEESRQMIIDLREQGIRERDKHKH